MRILVYGAGVIGSLTIHELCKAGNDVTVIARNHWKEVLKANGLHIRIGRKEYIDHPAVLSEYDGQTYDAVFSIMQNQQQEELLETLAKIHTQYLIFVGNNLTGEEMEARIRKTTIDVKTVLFGFQTTAGERHKEDVEAVVFGVPELTIGHLHQDMSSQEKAFFDKMFAGSEMKLTYMDDMLSWYRCHAVFILPIAYISYIHHCNLRTCTWHDMEEYLEAGKEAYGFLVSVGTKIRPKGDEKNLEGIRYSVLLSAMYLMAKTDLGEKTVTNHCRNAVTEIRFLDSRFDELRSKNSSFPMPVFDKLKSEMPSWQEVEKEYRLENPERQETKR